jgi:hypothetical protein
MKDILERRWQEAIRSQRWDDWRALSGLCAAMADSVTGDEQQEFHLLYLVSYQIYHEMMEE